MCGLCRCPYFQVSWLTGFTVSCEPESGSFLLTYLTHWTIQIQPTCCNMTWKFLIWNNAIDFFILGRIQIQSLAQTWKLWTPHALKQLEIISLFHTMIFQCIHQTQSKVHSLTRCQHLFSKEHSISGSHPDNLVCRWDPLDPPKVTQIVRVIWTTFNLEPCIS